MEISIQVFTSIYSLRKTNKVSSKQKLDKEGAIYMSQEKERAVEEGHYALAVEHNGLLHISGQLPIDMQTKKVVGETFSDQAKQALRNIYDILKKSNLEKENVVKCRVYLSDIKYWSEFNDIYIDFFKDHKPARVVIPSGQFFDGVFIEIEATAAVEGVLKIKTG